MSRRGERVARLSGVAVAAGFITSSLAVDTAAGDVHGHHEHAGHARADAVAPIGVMGDHRMARGEWMVSLRYMRMSMQDNLIGSDEVSPEQIVTSVPNRFAPPPTLRVVPTEMSMDMLMLGLMYAPSDAVTVMLMVEYLEKEMDHITFQGMMGTTRLGRFTTSSSGVGDSRVSALVRLLDDGQGNHLHLNLGLSLPTGSTTEEDAVLTPLNTRPTLRLPYPMQLGSGTYDLIPGLTYTGRGDRLGWGAQYLAVLRSGENDEGYTLGDEHHLSGWVSYLLGPGISGSLRLAGRSVGRIDGQDPEIRAPVQTADPDFQGGERVDALLGVNLAGLQDWREGHRVGIELGLPVHQDLNGPQLGTEWSATLGWQYTF